MKRMAILWVASIARVVGIPILAVGYLGLVLMVSPLLALEWLRNRRR